jgi:hypothetical protein
MQSGSPRKAHADTQTPAPNTETELPPSTAPVALTLEPHDGVEWVDAVLERRVNARA